MQSGLIRGNNMDIESSNVCISTAVRMTMSYSELPTQDASAG